MGAETLSQPSEFEQKVQFFKEFVLENGGIVPTLIVEGNRSAVMSNIRDIPETHEERNRMMLTLGMALAKEDRIGNIKQAWFASEAWMAMGSKDGAPPLAPSQDPRRMEILFVWNTRIDNGKIVNKGVVFEMKRDEMGILLDLRLVEKMTEENGHTINNPLMMSFFKGYKLGMLQANCHLN